MVYYKAFVMKLITEVQFRCKEGIVDFTNPTHISILSEILHEKNLSEMVDPILQFITEGPTPEKNPKPEKSDFKNPILRKTISYTNSNGDRVQGFVGNLLRMNKESDGYKKAIAQLGDENSDTYKNAMSDLGSQNSPKTQDSESDVESELDQDAIEREKDIKNTFSDPDYQKTIKADEEALAYETEKDAVAKKITIDSEYSQPVVGKLGDADDILSDGKIKQKGLNTGYRSVRGFRPAPGNKGSMLAEIMSGEAYNHLNHNPELSVLELASAMYEQVKDTYLGKQNGDYTKSTNTSGKYAGKNLKLMQKMEFIAASGKKKWERTAEGIQNLIDDDIFADAKVTTRNYYGHSQSIRKQVLLIRNAAGSIYTRMGVKIDKTEIIRLIEESGAGENPSDTSTITADTKGNLLIEFHSDKLTTSDIQANSTPNKEAENAKELIKKTENLSGLIKEQTLAVITDGQAKLKKKEEELKTAGAEPANIIKDMDMTTVLNKIKRGKNSKMMKGIIKSVLYKHRQPHPYLKDYLDTPLSGDDTHTTEELLKAYLDSYSDLENADTPTGTQVQFMNYLGLRYGIDISENLSNIRMDSIEIQRDTLKKLNERSLTLPNGETKQIGDYIEAQNIIDKLHLNVMDGSKSEGVTRYDGLFNLNMGGVIVEASQLKHCLGVEDTDDFIHNFELGNPDDGETITKNTTTGSVTGRNVFVYAITKKGKRIPFAFKTNRSKQGQSGTLNTTYQYHQSIQNCFKKNQ